MKYCREMYNGKRYGKDDVVPFFRPYEKNGMFSQWFIQCFTEDGIEFNCMEQYMMYYKALLFDDEYIADRILKVENPAVIKRLGRDVSNFDESVWDDLKIEIVVRGNLLKFTQAEYLGEELRKTGDAILVEASPYDKIWGIGMSVINPGIYIPNCWRGKNLLGFALMEVRDMLFNNTV